jgi:hypothetical protein
MNLNEHFQTRNHGWEYNSPGETDPEIFSDVTKELRLMGTRMKLQAVPKRVAEPGDLCDAGLPE